jgi:cyclopropane-fatty-acyl-phospholipid synthase
MEMISPPVVAKTADRSPTHGAATELLKKAAIHINGTQPWDMRLNNPGVPARAFAQGSLGLGEAYMDGDWDAEQLDEFFARLLRTRLTNQIRPLRLIGLALAAKFFNRQSVKRAKEVGEVHYDLGNDFYEAMLDKRLTYTCGYWHNAESLQEAQEAKLDLICRKLQLKPGMRVLDIGCGWGSFMAFAVEKYKVEATGVSISKEQVAWAKSALMPSQASGCSNMLAGETIENIWK